MREHKLFSRFSKLLLSFFAAITFFTLSSNNSSQPISADTTPTAVINAANQTDKITDQQYRNASATQLAAMVRSGQVTPQELIRHAFNIIGQDNPSLNAVIYTREQQALDEAGQLKDTGQPFYGVPILTKGLLQLIAGGSQHQWPFTSKRRHNIFYLTGNTGLPKCWVHCNWVDQLPRNGIDQRHHLQALRRRQQPVE
ncbi:hypothetical protein [Lentilactobacillus sunkii]|uniref:hypothetical protein n=1 Tax=Lentilactobacillus sunkii TaxID=481719 RepID=UPI00070BBCEC|nr:hypothetical protein [Lentilactobacillus sunkii]